MALVMGGTARMRSVVRVILVENCCAISLVGQPARDSPLQGPADNV